LNDKNLTLIRRLGRFVLLPSSLLTSFFLTSGHNVIKIGLRKISISYSRISLADVAEKLQLSSARAAEYICARAIKSRIHELLLCPSHLVGMELLKLLSIMRMDGL
jgi:hypothetical protein